MTKGAKSKWRAGVCAVFLVLAVAGIGAWLRLRPLFWARIMSGKAELNGHSVPSAYLYRGSRGDVMVYLHPRDPSNNELLSVVRMSRAEVGVVPPAYPYFWFVTRYAAFSKE